MSFYLSSFSLHLHDIYKTAWLQKWKGKNRNLKRSRRVDVLFPNLKLDLVRFFFLFSTISCVHLIYQKGKEKRIALSAAGTVEGRFCG